MKKSQVRSRTYGSLLGLCVALVFAFIASALPAAAEEIVMFTNDDPPTQWELRIEAWKKLHPEYKDLQVTQHYGTLEEALVLEAAGTPPDIIVSDTERHVIFAYNGMVEDLSPYIKDSPDILDGFIPDTVKAVQYKGMQVGLPVDWSAVAEVYNADMFNARGLVPPTADWTWDEFADTAARLTVDKDGDGTPDIYGFGDNFVNKNRYVNWIWSGGGALYNEDMTKTLIDSKESIAALQFYMSLITDRKVATTESASGPFTSGNLGIIAQSRYFMNRDFDFNVGVVPAPKGPAGSQVWMGTKWIGMHSASKHKEAVWSLIKFISSEEGYLAGNSDLAGALPALKRLAQEAVATAPEENAMSWVTAAAGAHPRIAHPAVPERLDKMIDWDGIVNGEKVLANELHSVAARKNAEIKEAWDRGPKW